MGKFIITEQERQHIKRLYNLITEAKTEDEMRTEFETKFPCTNWKNGTFKEEGGTISYTNYSTSKFTFKRNLDGTAEIIDGLLQGRKFKFECKDSKYDTTITQKSQIDIEIDNKLKNFPCFNQDSSNFKIRKTSDGKIVIGEKMSDVGGFIWSNLDDGTYFCKGGSLDGEKGKFSCNGNELVYGDITQSGTTKTVTKKVTPFVFSDVTKESPIIYGMRDGDNEGLIYNIQKKLKELNLYTGEPDGQFGPITLKAVEAFQTKNKDVDGNPLVKDGKIGPKTIGALGLYKY